MIKSASQTTSRGRRIPHTQSGRQITGTGRAQTILGSITTELEERSEDYRPRHNRGDAAPSKSVIGLPIQEFICLGLYHCNIAEQDSIVPGDEVLGPKAYGKVGFEELLPKDSLFASSPSVRPWSNAVMLQGGLVYFWRERGKMSGDKSWIESWIESMAPVWPGTIWARAPMDVAVLLEFCTLE